MDAPKQINPIHTLQVAIKTMQEEIKRLRSEIVYLHNKINTMQRVNKMRVDTWDWENLPPPAI